VLQLRRVSIAIAVLVAPSTRAAAQQTATPATAAAAGALRVAPSGRAMTQVSLVRQRAAGPAAPGSATAANAPAAAPPPASPPPAPTRITIDYGQPNARGRKIAGGVVPFGAVWRTGANEATSFTTDVDLTVGGVRVPRGAYTLYTLPAANGWQLIVNKQTGQWGTEYHAEQDLARIPLRSRMLTEPIESFTIWLTPSADPAPSGLLRLAWGDLELSTDWRVSSP
jgi:hypothetical protein